MIYILKACGTVLLAPFKCCEATCRCVGAACESAARCVGDVFGPITRNPLGGYVLVTLLAMLLTMAGAGLSIARLNGAAKSCERARTYCAAVLAMAFIHVAFAVYIQRRLVHHIGKDGSANMTFTEVAAKARHVAAYDFVFCFYVPFFAGTFGYACFGFTQLVRCSVGGPAWSAAALLVFYQLAVFHYAICWLGCHCCASVVEEVTGKAEGDAPAVVGQPVGAVMREADV